MILDGETIHLDLQKLPSPCFVVDQEALERNLTILDRVQHKAGVKILLALKGFSMFSTFPILKQVLAGTCASSVDEARLGREEFGGEVHTFSPAYTQETLAQILDLSNHVTFNSTSQWQRFRPLCEQFAGKVQFGLRLNPQHSEVSTPLYDPCASGSRLGIRKEALAGFDMTGISGLHFHTLCENDSFALERTMAAIDKRFGDTMAAVSWVNLGGGHHITRPGYDVEHLCQILRDFKNRHGVELYLEPGEAVALNAGIFVATVLDIVRNDLDVAILDCSISTHLPDVLEMPYRPEIIGAGRPGEKKYQYRLGGNSCLAGDVAGDYSFEQPLTVGDKLVFTDMAHYTMVKTTTFNGVRLPAIALANGNACRIVKEFGYDDFKNRLS
jgi:carboxynorspermidine decarboxylase